MDKTSAQTSREFLSRGEKSKIKDSKAGEFLVFTGKVNKASVVGMHSARGREVGKQLRDLGARPCMSL